MTSLFGSATVASAAVATTVSGWSTTTATGAIGYTFNVPVVVSTGTTKIARSVQVQRKTSTATTWTTL
ncbi:MAG TPA: hypothetical protein VGK18_00210, partial [Propionicimonas sp.]|uniref:hypothetical protein n=1 Tax=Propionicimonas sp. TaxID=1955623 RepID=UPI002F3FB740